jgi:hypothetical protein
MIKYLALEKERDIKRKENYLRVKLEVLGKNYDDHKDGD